MILIPILSILVSVSTKSVNHLCASLSLFHLLISRFLVPPKCQSATTGTKPTRHRLTLQVEDLRLLCSTHLWPESQPKGDRTWVFIADRVNFFNSFKAQINSDMLDIPNVLDIISLN